MFIECDKAFVKSISLCLRSDAVFKKRNQDSFYFVSMNGSFGDGERDMEWKLMKFAVWILVDEEGGKESARENLSFFCEKANFFAWDSMEFG